MAIYPRGGQPIRVLLMLSMLFAVEIIFDFNAKTANDGGVMQWAKARCLGARAVGVLQWAKAHCLRVWARCVVKVR